jgi:hypothetical protein
VVPGAPDAERAGIKVDVELWWIDARPHPPVQNPGMSQADLPELHRRIQGGAARREKQLADQGSIPILPRSEWLTDDDWLRVWEVLRELRREHIDVTVKFPEDTLAGLVVDIVAGVDDPPTLADLAQELDALAATEGPWLISTPIANIRLSEPVIAVAPEAVLWHAILGPQWLEDRDAASGDTSASEVHKLLGDRISQVTEWTAFDGHPIDTRRGATLLTVEEGVASLALPRARSRAQYAIAVWSLLSPPDDFEILPDLGIWVPQPHIHWSQRFKHKEDDAWIAREQVRGGTASHYAPYTAPGVGVLSAPFEAFAHLDRRCAQAMLSAALNLFNAMRRSRSELSSQLRNTMATLEVLCEKEGEMGAAEGRWSNVAARFDVWKELANRGYTQDDLEELQQRLKYARNIATHGADAALLDLGYPEQAQRQVAKTKILPGTDFAYSILAADLVPLRFALRFVLRELFQVVRDSGWDDSVFEAQFKP